MSSAGGGGDGGGGGDKDDKYARSKDAYKKTVDEAASSRKREEHLVKLGRVKKEAAQAVKRRVPNTPGATAGTLALMGAAAAA
jgi:hypothetical protein